MARDLGLVSFERVNSPGPDDYLTRVNLGNMLDLPDNHDRTAGMP